MLLRVTMVKMTPTTALRHSTWQTQGQTRTIEDQQLVEGAEDEAEDVVGEAAGPEVGAEVEAQAAPEADLASPSRED